MHLIKDILRKIYYLYANGRVTTMIGTHAAHGKKWIIDGEYGRAYFRGYYEPSLSRFINDNLKEDSVFVDAGSHAGYFSLIAASKIADGHVFSFEPDKRNFNYIEGIRNLNNLSNWTVENKGLGEREATLKFQSGKSSSTGKIGEEGDIEIPVLSLDKYFEDRFLQSFDLIKIDVEGHGGEVIKGAVQSILKYKPIILLENHRGSNEFAMAWDLLKLHYSFYDFETGREIAEPPSNQIDFLLLKPR